MRLVTLVVTVCMLVLYNKPEQKIAANAKPPLSKTKKISVLTGRCAVLVRPDNRKIALLKSEGAADDYAASVNDNEYYMGISSAFLDSVKLKQITRPAHGIVTFKSWSGQYFKVSLSPFYWGIILFNGRTKPVEADVTDIVTSYQAYMKK
jgi:hypothetical protein